MESSAGYERSPLADFQLENLLAACRTTQRENSGRLQSAEAIKAWAERVCERFLGVGRPCAGSKVALRPWSIRSQSWLAESQDCGTPTAPPRVPTKLGKLRIQRPTGVRVQLRMQGIIDKANKTQEDVLGDVLNPVTINHGDTNMPELISYIEATTDSHDRFLRIHHRPNAINYARMEDAMLAYQDAIYGDHGTPIPGMLSQSPPVAMCCN